MKNCNRIYTDTNCNIIIDDEFNKDFVNIYIIHHITSDNKYTNMILLKKEESDKIICDFKMDGHYSICKIDVPLDPMNPYYYSKEKEGFFKNLVEKVELSEVISVNPSVSNLKVEFEDYFCKCNLWKCYVKVCLEIFDKRASFKCDTPDVDSTLIYKRDLLNSAINVIDYMAELGQYSEAQRLLERITGCNGLCNETTTNGCGCV